MKRRRVLYAFLVVVGWPASSILLAVLRLVGVIDLAWWVICLPVVTFVIAVIGCIRFLVWIGEKMEAPAETEKEVSDEQ